MDRSKSEAYQAREARRFKSERDECERRALDAEAKLEEALKRPMAVILVKADLVFLALKLFLIARISFREVAKVLAVMAEYMGIAKPPCAQTVINWVTRLSIARIQDASQMAGMAERIAGDIFSNGFVWMIDATVGFGTGKVLAVLALNVRHHSLNNAAPNLNDVHCIAVSVAASWTGELVADFLKKVIGIVGRPAAFLKDGGSDLAKAVRLLGEQGLPCRSIADVSHFVANLFRRAYGEHPLFDTFISVCGKISQNIKLTFLACLAPPKTSTKARFMNLHRLIRWANLILALELPRRAFGGALAKKLRTAFDELPACREYIADFLRDAQAMSECQKVLKNRGLNNETAAHCKKIVEVIPQTSPIRAGFTQWLDEHYNIATELGVEQCGLTISSDQIESLYGLAKQHGAGEVKDANRIGLHLPALTGTLTKRDAERVLEITTADQHAVEAPLTSLTKQRRAIQKNPQDVERLVDPSKQGFLEMLPRSKNDEKNPETIEISECYKKVEGLSNTQNQSSTSNANVHNSA